MGETRHSESIREVLSLYELALAVGGSMDPQEVCEQFLTTLISRRNLSYASVWLDPRLWPGGEGDWYLVASMPPARTRIERLVVGDPLFARLKRGSWTRVTDSEPGFRELTIERGVSGGVHAVFWLAGVGLLKLFSSDPSAMQDRDLARLEAVIEKFASALEGALAHRQLYAEMEQRVRAQHALVRQQDMLRSRKAELRALIDNIPSQAWMTDTQGRFIAVNEPFAKACGIVIDDILGKTGREIWALELAKTYCREDERVRRTGRRSAAKIEQMNSGVSTWYESSISPIFGSDGIVVGTVGLASDITERIESEKALQDAEERARLLLDHSTEGIFGIDAEGRTTFVNPAAAQMLGYSVEELIGRPSHAMLHHAYPDGAPMPESESRMLKAARTGKRFHVEDEVLWRKDGTSFPVEYHSNPIYRAGELYGAVVTFHDISERREAEQQIRHMAFHDALTHLPNRRLFMDRLEQQLALIRRYGHKVALHLLDLDHFKDVNDTMGHPVGDSLLKEVAIRLQGVIRESDTLARLGGDEFAVLQVHVDHHPEVAAMASNLLAAMREPFSVSGRNIVTSTSIGTVICAATSEIPADDVLAHADVALYNAKESGRDDYRFYEDVMRERVENESRIARRLSLALSENRFSLAYQPQIDLATRELTGVEALLRWNDTVLGNVLPGDFISVAEKRGMIDGIGLWVVDEVCRQARSWLARGCSFGRVAFNVSPHQLRNSRGVERIGEIIDAAGIPYTCVEIEVTESGYMEAQEASLAVLANLIARGVQVAIDDFGTGYSSMLSLRQLTASRIKIDREFVKDMLTDPGDAAIVKGIIALGRSLGLQVVAEGIEAQEQVDVLVEHGCHVGQGYFFSEPIAALEVARRFFQGCL
jgi:diguanylate cyclase (GGDEF)-like protein/PAS domain S-box-containing protein